MNRRLRISVLAASLALAICAPVASAADCPGSDLRPGDENIEQVSAATLCLVNGERAAAGLPGLVRQVELDQASVSYSQQMVDEQFFEHVAPDGATLVDRLTGSGYLGDADSWTVGENIAWGEAQLGTPEAIVRAWMNSPGHRQNILSSDYAEIGVGIAIGVPVGDSAGATYTTDFGRRTSTEQVTSEDIVVGADPGSTTRPSGSRRVAGRKGATRRRTETTKHRSGAHTRKRSCRRSQRSGATAARACARRASRRY